MPKYCKSREDKIVHFLLKEYLNILEGKDNMFSYLESN
jgi:tRNA U34 5-carboxymethylaminomethyl modifying enzyme MnmG/GidA